MGMNPGAHCTDFPCWSAFVVEAEYLKVPFRLPTTDLIYFLDNVIPWCQRKVNFSSIDVSQRKCYLIIAAICVMHTCLPLIAMYRRKLVLVRTVLGDANFVQKRNYKRGRPSHLHTTCHEGSQQITGRETHEARAGINGGFAPFFSACSDGLTVQGYVVDSHFPAMHVSDCEQWLVAIVAPSCHQ